MKESQIIAKLRRRFDPPAWAFFAQVPNATGALQRRTIDALAMSLYPSRGLHLHAIEVKVRRPDWLRELKKPEKADLIAAQTDFMWIAAPKGVVEVEELPHGWGLLVPHGATMRAAHKADLIEAGPTNRPFLAAILRRACENAPGKEMLKAARAEGHAEGRKDAEQAQASKESWLKRDIDRLKDERNAFAEACGLDMATFASSNYGSWLGRVAKTMLDRENVRATVRRLENQAALAEEAGAKLRAAAKALRMEPDDPPAP